MFKVCMCENYCIENFDSVSFYDTNNRIFIGISVFSMSETSYPYSSEMTM
jgi:hypothetical protein